MPAPAQAPLNPLKSEFKVNSKRSANLTSEIYAACPQRQQTSIASNISMKFCEIFMI